MPAYFHSEHTEFSRVRESVAGVCKDIKVTLKDKNVNGCDVIQTFQISLRLLLYFCQFTQSIDPWNKFWQFWNVSLKLGHTPLKRFYTIIVSAYDYLINAMYVNKQA
jgi:hypothetical protein